LCDGKLFAVSLPNFSNRRPVMDKETLDRMISVCRRLARALQAALEAFGAQTTQTVEEADRATREARKAVAELPRFLLARKSPEGAGLEVTKEGLAIASGFDRILYSLEGLLNRLKKIVHEEIPFSDRAIRETDEIFKEGISLLENLPDLLLTRNRLLGRELAGKGRAAIAEANRHGEAHLERMIEGVCIPKASPIYLGILESLKVILGNCAEICTRVTGDDPGSP
jgi:Na+/phosphate symporter